MYVPLLPQNNTFVAPYSPASLSLSPPSLSRLFLRIRRPPFRPLPPLTSFPPSPSFFLTIDSRPPSLSPSLPLPIILLSSSRKIPSLRLILCARVPTRCSSPPLLLGHFLHLASLLTSATVYYPSATNPCSLASTGWAVQVVGASDVLESRGTAEIERCQLNRSALVSSHPSPLLTHIFLRPIPHREPLRHVPRKPTQAPERVRGGVGTPVRHDDLPACAPSELLCWCGPVPCCSCVD